MFSPPAYPCLKKRSSSTSRCGKRLSHFLSCGLYLPVLGLTPIMRLAHCHASPDAVEAVRPLLWSCSMATATISASLSIYVQSSESSDRSRSLDQPGSKDPRGLSSFGSPIIRPTCRRSDGSFFMESRNVTECVLSMVMRTDMGARLRIVARTSHSFSWNMAITGFRNDRSYFKL